MQLWSRISLRRKLELIMFALALPILLTLVVMLNTSIQLKSALDERTRYRDFIADLSDLKIAMLNIETGQRGYRLSGNSDFLQPYKLGLVEASKKIDRLLASNIYPETVQRLQKAINDYIHNWAEPSIIKVKRGQLVSQENYASFLAGSKDGFDEVRKLFSVLEEGGNRRFEQSRATTLKGVETLNAVAWIIAVTLMMVILVLRIALDRVIMAGLFRLQKSITEIAMGDYASRVPVVSGDELGRLGTSFNLMAAFLEQSHRDLKQARERAELLASLSDALQNADSSEEVAHIALSGLGTALGATNLYLNLLDGEDLKVAGWWGPPYPHRPDTVENPLPPNTASATKLLEVIHSGKAFYNAAYGSPEDPQKIALAIEPVPSPSGHRLGSLSAVRPSQNGQWEEGERLLVRGAAATLGIALERASHLVSLMTVNAKLQQSNQELEQFAYVASHDLQEPLRMVSSYTQLLARRYEGKLDEKADQYIHFAADGANRMQGLVRDLLAFSRVGTWTKPLEPIESAEVLQEVLQNLKVSIEESKAQVIVGVLPKIMADGTQMAQVFQNLISNALKYRHPKRIPRIEVGADLEGTMWRFYVSDNGIGIEAQYFERIFVIFQRLHSKEEYAGTGIGLALVKKIVERHGGKIGLESKPDQGSHFWFTWPA